jgi:hypothetical protein
MRLTMTSALASVVLVACGGSGTVNPDGGGGNPDSGGGSPDSGQGGNIPDPGTTDGVDNNWGSVQPNNTPAQATPLGTAVSGNIYTWVNTNAIGGGDSANYFVFRTSADAGTLSFDFCFTPSITAMTATLWQVSNSQEVQPPVGSWQSTGTCVTNTPGLTAIQANTVYLFGLTATGDAGTYSA